MKKMVLLFGVFALFFIGVLPSMTSVNETAVENGYQCLENLINSSTCESLSTSEKIFSLLAVNDCRSELLNDSQNRECWPSGNCDVKTTSQAILALDTGVSNSTNWLKSQNGTTSELDWYLQIDSTGTSSCTISHSSNQYSVEIGSDKKLTSSNIGGCLSISPNGYWVGVSETCYNEEYSISCDAGFVTNLIFQKEGSSTVHVSEKTTSASAGGTIKEKINSFCFKNPGEQNCDYEASLWATMVLDSREINVDPYLPYLVAMIDESENEKFLPESFLHQITGLAEFNTQLNSRQVGGYWDTLSDYSKYYDTAVALLSFSTKITPQKLESEEALLNDQMESGCWNSNNLLDTAFVLYSLWPDLSPSEGQIGTDEECSSDLDCSTGYDCSDEGFCVLENPTNSTSCVGAGYSCLSYYNCAYETEGEILDDYSCSSDLDVCCSVPQPLDSCEVLGGEICSTGETCSGSSASSSDSNACCLGTCTDGTSGGNLDCETFGGTCEVSQCGEGFAQDSDLSCSFGDICCMPESKSTSSSSWIWILILGILILLVVLGIVFKDKLKTIWLKMKSGSKSSSRPRFGPGFPPFPSSSPRPHRIVPRRIIPSSRPPAPSRIPQRKPKSSSELDEILEKLKRIGK